MEGRVNSWPFRVGCGATLDALGSPDASTAVLRAAGPGDGPPATARCRTLPALAGCAGEPWTPGARLGAPGRPALAEPAAAHRIRAPQAQVDPARVAHGH